MSLTLIWPFNDIQGQILSGKLKGNIWFTICISYKLSSYDVPGFSVTAPWAFIWFLDGNENKVDISIVGTNGKFFLINAHGVLRRMGAATEIPGTVSEILAEIDHKGPNWTFLTLKMTFRVIPYLSYFRAGLVSQQRSYMMQ